MATSKIDMEAKQKHCFKLRVDRACKFSIEKVPLRTVRPMLYKCIELHESKIDPSRVKLIENYIANKIEETLQSFFKEQGDLVETPIPIVRLKIEYGINKYQVLKS